MDDATYYMNLLHKALPEFFAVQPRDHPRFVQLKRRPTQGVELLIEATRARQEFDLALIDPMSALKTRPPIWFEKGIDGKCIYCTKPGALETCTHCKGTLHLSCAKLVSPTDEIVCPACQGKDATKQFLGQDPFGEEAPHLISGVLDASSINTNKTP